MTNGLILLSVFGFIIWAFLQNTFVKNSSNINAETRLLFPIIVPILSGVLVFIGYFIFFKHSPHEAIATSFKNNINIAFLVLAAVGLAAAYFLYTVLITIDFKNAVLITVLNVFFLTIAAFFLSYENDKFIFKLNANASQIIGAVITLLGVVVMKYGNDILLFIKNKIFK